MPAFLRPLLAAVFLVLSAGLALAQNPYGGRATNYYIIDVGTGQVLAEQNAEIPLPPASMSKLLTLALLFDALREGRVQPDTTWTISARAHAMQGSTMFLETRHRPTTLDLIRGIAVVSGNDAAVAVAEGLGGTEEGFAAMAEQRAAQIGMTQTTVANASGWPDPRHRMSLHDLGVLARYIIREHPEYYRILGETEFTWNGITQPNRVPLLHAGLGMDGLKTGHTEEAGFSLVGSAVQGSRRVVFVFSGLASATERVEEAERIIGWTFRQFVERPVVAERQPVALADVWLGEVDTVQLVASRAVTVLVPVLAVGEMQARVEYHGPLAAPIAEGQEVATLVVDVPGLPAVSVPLLAANAVAEGGILRRLRAAARVLGGHLGLITP